MRSQLAYELVAIHRRHQNVGNDELRTLLDGDAQAVRPIRRLYRRVAFVPQEGEHDLAVGGVVVNDQNLRHRPCRSVEQILTISRRPQTPRVPRLQSERRATGHVRRGNLLPRRNIESCLSGRQGFSVSIPA